MNNGMNRLPPDVFDAVVRALAEALVADYRGRWSPGFVESPTPSELAPASPWLTVKEAAARARCSAKVLYREVNAGRLRAVRVGGRRSVRFRAEWVDEWLERSAPALMPAKEIEPRRFSADTPAAHPRPRVF